MSSQEIPEEKHLPSEQGDDARHGGVSESTDDPFADPGLPAHKPRIQDIDERAAKRSERTVAILFTLSMLATVGFIASLRDLPGRQDRLHLPARADQRAQLRAGHDPGHRRSSASARARSTGPAP